MLSVESVAGLRQAGRESRSAHANFRRRHWLVGSYGDLRFPGIESRFAPWEVQFSSTIRGRSEPGSGSGVFRSTLGEPPVHKLPRTVLTLKKRMATLRAVLNKGASDQKLLRAAARLRDARAQVLRATIGEMPTPIRTPDDDRRVARLQAQIDSLTATPEVEILAEFLRPHTKSKEIKPSVFRGGAVSQRIARTVSGTDSSGD